MQRDVNDSCLIKVQPGGWVMGSARATVTITARENERRRDLMRTQDLSSGEAARRAIMEEVGIKPEPPIPCDHARELEELRERARALSVARAEWRDLALALVNRQAHHEGHPPGRPQAHPLEHPPGRPQAHPLEHPPGRPLEHYSRIHVQTDTKDALRDRSRAARIIRVRRRDGTSYLAQMVE
jgi:8-oxo-dGTP pyrophosphatase MutT (NUDIX family)